MIGNAAAVWSERQTVGAPGDQTARHRVRAEPGAAERERGGRRPRADAAVEHHGPLRIERPGLLGEAPERDVPGAGDVAGDALVRLADVDQVDAARGMV